MRGNIYKERKRAARGRDIGGWLFVLVFLAGLVVYNFYHRGRRLGCIGDYSQRDKREQRVIGVTNKVSAISCVLTVI